MIDIDKVKAALASTPICQHSFYKPGDGGNPAMMCAVSAMLSFAGVPERLIRSCTDAHFESPESVMTDFAKPVLLADYGIPYETTKEIPNVFDGEKNEYRAIQKLLDHFALLNAQDEAWVEECVRQQEIWRAKYSNIQVFSNPKLLRWAVELEPETVPA